MKSNRLLGFSSLAVTVALLFFVSVAQAAPIYSPHYKPKWSQLPDMDTGIDTLSMHRSFGPVVADDFRSDGRPITGFRWWGSYFQDVNQGPNRDVSFEISLHLDCPAFDATCNNGGPYDYATPSDGNYFSAIITAEEKYFGTTSLGDDVFEYWFSVEGLLGPDFWGGTWNEVAGEIYWLDVAWNAGQFGSSISDDVWGWHDSFEQNLASAVTTASGGPANPHIGPWDRIGRDKAFEVLTVPEPPIALMFAVGFAAMFLRRQPNALSLPNSLSAS